MTLNEFFVEYDMLTIERQRTGLRRFVKQLADLDTRFDIIDISDELIELMDILRDFEADDIFGTEGMSL